MASSMILQPSSLLTETIDSTNTIKAPKKLSKGHRCYFCGQKFVDKNYLRKHISAHKDRDHLCNVCNKGFPSRLGLNKHAKIHSGERPFLCDKCPKTFVQRTTLMTHLKTVHSEHRSGLSCKSCGKNMRSQNEQCWLCRYLDKEMPKDGQISVNPGSVFDLMKVNNSQNLEIGSSMYISDKIPNIPVVNTPSGSNNLLYKNSIELKNEAQSSTTNVYVCYHCNAEHCDLNLMKEHIQTHPNLKTHVCERCGKDFLKKGRLTRHMLTHREDHPFVCNVCRSRFKTLSSLKQHVGLHNKNRPYKCKECGAEFKTIPSLRLHVRIHTDGRQSACNHCGKTFMYVLSLQRHIRIHTGERPYQCKYCDKRFSQASGLKAHEQTHQKTINLVEETCNSCGKQFRSLSNFKKHQLVCC